MLILFISDTTSTSQIYTLSLHDALPISNWTPESKNSMVFDGTETDAIVELKDVSTTYEQIIAQMEADTSISPELKEKVIKNVMNGRWFSDTLDQHFQSPNLWDVSIQ